MLLPSVLSLPCLQPVASPCSPCNACSLPLFYSLCIMPADVLFFDLPATVRLVALTLLAFCAVSAVVCLTVRSVQWSQPFARLTFSSVQPVLCLVQSVHCSQSSSSDSMNSDPIVLCCSRLLGCAFPLFSLGSARSRPLGPCARSSPLGRSVHVMPASVCSVGLLLWSICAMLAAVIMVAWSVGPWLDRSCGRLF